MHNNVGCCKKRKRGERVFKFKSFGHPGHPAADFDGPFHRNVRALLEFGHPEPSLLGGGLPCWSFQLEIHGNPPVIIHLYVVEDQIKSSSHRHCHHCRHIGWGHHMICNERFHFVLPSHKTMPALLVQPDFDRGRRCNSKTTPTGLDFLDHDGHLMHGIVHSNGFGHLLRVNGFEGGSEFVSGHRIMDLWDRLCTRLKARKVSLTDVAKKASMELRLVHGIAYGEPWFGLWGYKFGRGSYGVTPQSYQKSIQAVRDLPLSLLAHTNLRRADLAQTPIIISKYQTIAAHPMHNLAHLFRCMLELKHRLPPDPIKFMDYHAISTEPACRWSPKRVEMAARVIVESLKKARFKWVSRQEVRDAARIYIGDTGLLDFVLKSLGDHVVGNHMVRRTVNPATKVLEYCLEDVAADARAHTCSARRAAATFGFKFTRAQLAKDIAHVYNRALCERGVAAAVQAILDAKHLVKDFRREPREGHVKAVCAVLFGDRKRAMSPDEGVVAGEAERRFGELYWGLRGFVAEKVEETAEGVVVEGRAAAVEAEMVEGGDDERYVECACGARGDDGERMIGCDVCDVWQHTRCIGMSAGEDVPRVFICARCERHLCAFPSVL